MIPRGVQITRVGTTHYGNNQEIVVIRKVTVKDLQFMGILWRFFPFVYRLGDRGAILLQVCRERKWKPMSELSREEEYLCHQTWNLWWRTSTVKGVRFPALHPWQTVNFIPNAANYCSKDFLVRYLRRMNTAYPSLYDYGPMSFNLPQEFSQMVTEHRKRNGIFSVHSTMDKPKVVWIAKPVGKSQGKGIFVFDRCTNLKYDDQYVVQEYIQHPFLINGFKWDLRIYVCITCNNPLTIYAYEEGIVRFATSKYDLSNLGNSFSHLTNSFINKRSPAYYKHKETIGFGSKWTLAQLRQYFKKENVQDYILWQKIWSILVLTIIGNGQEIAGAGRCWEDNGFQFLGYDVLVDENLKPYLLEVNLHPGLGSDKCAADLDVKIPLLHDMFDLLNLPDGRRFPEPAILSANGVESTTQLCEKIMEALKDSEPEQYEFLLGWSKLNKAKEKPRPKGSRSSVNRRSEISKSLPRGSKGSVSKASSVLNPNLDPNNNELSELPEGKRRKTKITPQTKSECHTGDIGTTKNKANGSTVLKTSFLPPLVVRLPTLKKSSATLQLPSNGPGLTFPTREWNDAPAVCGKWVRIFPFDEVTSECNTFQVYTDPTDCIKRVGVHLQTVRELGAKIESKGLKVDDSWYDKKLQKHLNTKIWHPS